MPSQRLREIGDNALAAIRDLLAAYEVDYDRLQELRDEAGEGTLSPLDVDELRQLELDAGDCESVDDALQRIEEDPLSLEVRCGWTTLDRKLVPEEYCILLTTGGPAVRIVGNLDEYDDPVSATLEVQDWGTPWTRHIEYDDVHNDVLRYAKHFWFHQEDQCQ